MMLESITNQYRESLQGRNINIQLILAFLHIYPMKNVYRSNCWLLEFFFSFGFEFSCRFFFNWLQLTSFLMLIYILTDWYIEFSAFYWLEKKRKQEKRKEKKDRISRKHGLSFSSPHTCSDILVSQDLSFSSKTCMQEFAFRHSKFLVAIECLIWWLVCNNDKRAHDRVEWVIILVIFNYYITYILFKPSRD